MEKLERINSSINSIVWGPYMLLLLLGVGIYFSFRLHFFQLTGFRIWWSRTAMSFFGKRGGKRDKDGISPVQALTAALAGSVGTGNIVGVANAIALGGAGAVFWMWAAAFFGMATVMAENVLGVKYREKRNGEYVGGPMYYIEKGLKCRWLAVIFALFCIMASFGMGNLTQANSVAGALSNGFGVPAAITAPVLAVIVGFIIFGGIKRIAVFTDKLVPIMTALYMTVVLIVLIVNFVRLPSAFTRIISEAFDLKAAAGGFMGYGMMRALKYGISRGVFSNEAGLGSSPIVHSAANTVSPYNQGMWGIFQVFIDTIVLCTLMALCILVTGADGSGLDGIAMSAMPFNSVLGDMGNGIVSLLIALFAFATLISWSYYGEKALEYLSRGRGIKTYRLVYAAVACLGCITGISLVWEISDTINGLMAIPNLAALILLSSQISYKELSHSISGDG